MKFLPLTFCLAAAFCLPIFTAQAARSERVVTIAFNGFFQDENRYGDNVATAFRATTRDFLIEISLTTGQNFTNGTLLVVESLDDTNAPIQIIARRGTNQLDVSGFFDFSKNDNYVLTERFSRGNLSSQTFYAVDDFSFSTLAADPKGLSVTFKSFSQETLRFFTPRIGGQLFDAVSTTLRTDGVGEFASGDGFIGPIRGYIIIGAPRFYP